MRKKLLFIFNPRAGKAQITNELVSIIDIFTKAGYDVLAHPTQAHGDAFDFITERGAEFETVVISGGDGTLSNAINGIMRIENKDDIKVGYIPSGSTNDFANSLGIPKSMTDAANMIVEGNFFKCDIGSFNTKNFTYVAGFGAFTDVSYETPQETKNMFGHFAYIMEGIGRLTSIPSYAMKINYDGKKAAGEFMLGMVMNSNYVAGIKGEKIVNADLGDGYFELLLIRTPANIMDLQAAVSGILRGEEEGKNFLLTKVQNVTFETEDEIKWTLDGEYGGNEKHAEVSAVNGAVNIFVPVQE